MSLTDVKESVSRLGDAERAELLDFLWETFQSKEVHARQAKWASDAEERINALDRGELETHDYQSAMKDVKRRLRK